MNVKMMTAQYFRHFFGVLSVFFCTACNPSLSSVSIDKPFGLGRGGESVEFDFRVKETYGYVVRLKVYFHNPKEFEDHRARTELINQLGARFAADGSIPFVRVPIALRIRVKSIEVQGPPVDFDLTTDQIGFVDAFKEFATKEVQMRINNQKLQPGTYHIRVDNLHPVPEFADRTVRLALHHASQGK